MFRAAAVAMAILATSTLGLSAHAVPLTDTVDTGGGTYISSGNTSSPCPSGFACGPGWVSFTHSIADAGFTIGDTVANATLTIHLGELTATGVNHETYRYDIGAQTFGCATGNCVPNSGLFDPVALDAGSLADLADDGMLQITINALSGGFFFVSSLLSAEVIPNIAPVESNAIPVPATLLLLLAGFGALGASRASGSIRPFKTWRGTHASRE